MEYYTAIGIDVSDKTSKICVMTKAGGTRRIVAETTVATTKDGFYAFLNGQDRNVPVTFETGVHCRWMAEHIRGMGFKVYVANPAKLKLLTESDTKNDRNDARALARYTLADPEMLHPVFLRDEEHQQMIRLIEARSLLIRERTRIINELRGFAKSMGFRIPKKDAAYFHKLDRSSWPQPLNDLAWPLFDILEMIALKVKAYESGMRKLVESPAFKDDIERVRRVFGIGFICSAAFIAFLGGNYERFVKARDVGPYLGLTPKQDQSGNINKQLGITRKGSALLMCLLTECAQIVLKDSSPMTDPKLKGMRIFERGGSNARKRAVTAVARGLAVTMMALLKHPERDYKPVSDANLKLLGQPSSEQEVKAA